MPGADSYDAEAFISERVRQYQTWYDKKAVWAKKRFLFMRGFSVVGGSVVPVLINVPNDVLLFGVPVLKALVTLTSLLVVIAVSLESVLHYREQWKNYRSTEQLLVMKRWPSQTRLASTATELPMTLLGCLSSALRMQFARKTQPH